MNCQNLQTSFFFQFKPVGFLPNKLIFGILVMLLYFYGCGTVQNTNYMDLNELNETFQLRHSPTKRPPTSLQGLISHFGDIPQVHTYLTLREKMEKILEGELDEKLTLAEFIDYLTAEVYLYPSKSTAELLERLNVMKKRFDAEGSPDTYYIDLFGKTE